MESDEDEVSTESENDLEDGKLAKKTTQMPDSAKISLRSGIKVLNMFIKRAYKMKGTKGPFVVNPFITWDQFCRDYCILAPGTSLFVSCGGSVVTTIYDKISDHMEKFMNTRSVYVVKMDIPFKLRKGKTINWKSIMSPPLAAKWSVTDGSRPCEKIKAIEEQEHPLDSKNKSTESLIELLSEGMDSGENPAKVLEDCSNDEEMRPDQLKDGGVDEQREKDCPPEDGMRSERLIEEVDLESVLSSEDDSDGPPPVLKVLWNFILKGHVEAVQREVIGLKRRGKWLKFCTRLPMLSLMITMMLFPEDLPESQEILCCF